MLIKSDFNWNWGIEFWLGSELISAVGKKLSAENKAIESFSRINFFGCGESFSDMWCKKCKMIGKYPVQIQE